MRISDWSSDVCSSDLHPGVQPPDFPEAVVGEVQPVLDLLGCQLHQALVNDVADMLEIRGEGHDVAAPAAVFLAERFAADFGEVQLDRLVPAVARVVHMLDLAHPPPTLFLQAGKPTPP